MRRIHFVSMMAVVIAIPAAAAGSYFSLSDNAVIEKPCFVAGNTGYRLAAGDGAAHVVRIDNAAANPSLRLHDWMTVREISPPSRLRASAWSTVASTLATMRASRAVRRHVSPP